MTNRTTTVCQNCYREPPTDNGTLCWRCWWLWVLGAHA